MEEFIVTHRIPWVGRVVLVYVNEGGRLLLLVEST